MSNDKKVPVWDNNFSFLMAMIGAAIGLGNIWRYPYVAYSNGGGTFLIPYLCAIFILGLPFLFLEYSVGFKFKTSLSEILKKIKPKFEVIGWFVALISFLILLSSISLLIIIYKIIISNKFKIENEFMKEKINLEYRYYKKIEENQEKIKRIYHDINNHMICISNLSNEKDVKEYVKSLDLNIGYINFNFGNKI